MKHNDERSKHTPDSEIEADDLEDDADDLDDPDYDIDRYGFDVSPNGDADRYTSARGWEPPDPHKKARDKYRREHPELHCTDTLFETKPANAFLKGTAAKPPAALFGDMWRKGELAVLVGEPGVGKSIFAMQIAETVARGATIDNGKLRMENSSENSQFSRLNSQLAPAQPVLYLDLERSADQFKQRYSCPSPIPGKLPVKYRFSPKLRRTGYGDLEIPSEFRGDFSRYFDHSLNLTLTGDATKVIVIDNLSCLDPRGGTQAAVRRMRSLKLYAAETGVSILVITHLKPRRGRVSGSPHYKGGVAASRGRGGSLRSLELSDLAPEIAQIADSVFAISRSTYHSDIRYIKHLKANYVPIDNGKLRMENGSENSQFSHLNSQLSSDVLVFNLGRMESAKWKIENGSENSQFSILISQFPPKPFLGFEYLGVSAEQDHLRDYSAPLLPEEGRTRSGRGGGSALAIQSAEQRRLKRQRDPKNVVDMFLSPEYGRYLRGE